METAMVLVGLVLVFCALGMRFSRRLKIDSEVREAEYALKDAQFWHDASRRYRDPKLRLASENLNSLREKPYGTSWQRVLFNLKFFVLLIPGVLILLFLYLGGENQRVGGMLGFSGAIAMVIYFFAMSVVKPLGEVERESAWLNKTVRSLKTLLDGKKDKEYEEDEEGEEERHLSFALKEVYSEIAYANLLRSEWDGFSDYWEPEKKKKKKDYIERYRQAFERAVKQASEIKENPDHDMALQRLIDLCVEHEDFKSASALMQKMLSADNRRDAAQQIKEEEEVWDDDEEDDERGPIQDWEDPRY